MIIFGIIILIIGLLLKKEFVEFSSSTLKIRECVVLKFLTL